MKDSWPLGSMKMTLALTLAHQRRTQDNDKTDLQDKVTQNDLPVLQQLGHPIRPQSCSYLHKTTLKRAVPWYKLNTDRRMTKVRHQQPTNNNGNHRLRVVTDNTHLDITTTAHSDNCSVWQMKHYLHIYEHDKYDKMLILWQVCYRYVAVCTTGMLDLQ
jgi:hypothetical protein